MNTFKIILVTYYALVYISLFIYKTCEMKQWLLVQKTESNFIPTKVLQILFALMSFEKA